MAYSNTEEYRKQGGRGTFKLTNDFFDTPYSGKYVRDINFTPDDGRLADQAVCRVYSSREDAEMILKALQERKEE